MSLSGKSKLDHLEARPTSSSTSHRTCNMLRSRRRLLVWIATLIASIVLLSRTAYVVANRRADFHALAALERAMTPPEHPQTALALDGNRKILIVQHVRGKRLDRASELSHKLYAAAWGYQHKTTSGNYCGRNVHGSFNKQFVLREAIREALNDKTADWIL